MLRPSPIGAGSALPASHVTSALPSRPRHGTMVDALEAAATVDGALFTLHVGKDPQRVTGASLLEGAHRWAAELRRAGVRRGDRVPILLPTSPDFVHALLGAMLAGAAPAPLASPLTFGSLDRYLDNLAAVVEDAEARVCITTAKVREALARSARLTGALHTVLVPEELGSGGAGGPLPSLHPSDTAMVQYTSGTTGRPKGAVISHRALTSNAFAIAEGLGLREDDVGVSWLPLFHDMGLVGVLLTGVCHPYPVHLLRPDQFVMRPGRWLGLLSEVGGTLSAAPNFAYDLCVSRIDATPEVDLTRWRVALNGAEPVHAVTADRFRERFGPVGFGPDVMMPVYGMAEATLAVTFPGLAHKLEIEPVDREALEERRTVLPGAEDAHRAVSCGRPVAGASVRVCRDGLVVAEREVGEIEVAGPSLMDGYFRNEEASAAALRDGWLRTGDLGFLDRGRLFVAGRAKDVIIKGGRNIHPHDVERIASEVRGVRGGVAAFARTNEATGTDDLVVVAEVRGGDDAERARMAKEIRGELLAVLGVKADEVALWPVGSLPRTTSGKIRRGECRKVLARGGPS